jgi:hypothetical protein
MNFLTAERVAGTLHSRLLDARRVVEASDAAAYATKRQALKAASAALRAA